VTTAIIHPDRERSGTSPEMAERVRQTDVLILSSLAVAVIVGVSLAVAADHRTSRSLEASRTTVEQVNAAPRSAGPLDYLTFSQLHLPL